jgi:hypothetical protein
MTAASPGETGTGRGAAGPEQARRIGRRRLLRGLAGGGAAVVLTPRAAGAAGATSPPEQNATVDHGRIGFEASEHTRWFYHRARW